MTIKVHFDGEVFIPDEPVNLAAGTSAHVEHPDSPALKNYVTAAELLDSGVIGIWENRKDIDDSVQFARELRERAQRREI